MSHDDPSTNDATKKPPDREGRSLLRTGAWRSLALIVVAGLTGCNKYEFAFGPSSGKLHFEGSDRMGPFSGDVRVWDCQGRLVGGATEAYFGGKSDLISLGDDGESVRVSTRGGGWKLVRSECSAFDVRKWFDAEQHLHVVVVVDCTSAEGVHVQGSVRSDACYVNRPR